MSARNLRLEVGRMMVAVHLASPELADYWIAKMDADELQHRYRYYIQRGLDRAICPFCERGSVRAFPSGGYSCDCCECLWSWGTELSAERRNQESGSDFYPVFGSATATARLSVLNPAPELPTEQRNGQANARAGNKKPGPMVDRALSAIH
ncbi:MAG TPA: hypothetical protein VE866_08385 [Candidatus Binatia bacterium]|nr:hypothetical protein [Candidatus Binatia bacterium]